MAAEVLMDKIARGKRIVGSERQELAEDFARRYEAGDTIRVIAADAGRSYGFVHRVLAENGVTLRARGGDTKRRNP